MAYFHCWTQIRIWTRIQTPSPMVTLYYAELFLLLWIRIQIPVQMVSRMVTLLILGTDLQTSGKILHITGICVGI